MATLVPSSKCPPYPLIKMATLVPSSKGCDGTINRLDLVIANTRRSSSLWSRTTASCAIASCTIATGVKRTQVQAALAKLVARGADEPGARLVAQLQVRSCGLRSLSARLRTHSRAYVVILWLCTHVCAFGCACAARAWR